VALAPAARAGAGKIPRVDAEHPERDQDWDHAVRNETEAERLDRNWTVLLQELRVTQTGVQLLTGLLLTLPFQQRFTLLTDPLRIVYLVTVACSVASTVLLVAPVGMHRVLFRQHRLDTLVATAHWCAVAGLLLLGTALVGVTIVVFGTVAGSAAGWIAGGFFAAAFLTLWISVPLFRRMSGHGPG
jgi:Family of unknown function (DUF6328)